MTRVLVINCSTYNEAARAAYGSKPCSALRNLETKLTALKSISEVRNNIQQVLRILWNGELMKLGIIPVNTILFSSGSSLSKYISQPFVSRNVE